MVVHFDKISDLPKKLQGEAEKQGFKDLFEELEDTRASLADVAGVQKGVENLAREMDLREVARDSSNWRREHQLDSATEDIRVLEGKWKFTDKCQLWIFLLALAAFILAIVGIFV